MMDGSISTATRHDAGGRARYPLLEGVTGSAYFDGDHHEHRLTLARWWGKEKSETPPERFALWIGMNPSTAEADIDDLTIRKEQTWTRMLDLDLACYVKMNVATYRCTDPLGLVAAAEQGNAVHPENLDTIISKAVNATVVILATGQVPACIAPVADELFKRLRAAVPWEKVRCLGWTKRGWPKHSSRIGYNTPIVEWPASGWVMP